MVQIMMRPSRDIVRRYQIPRSVLAEVYSRNPRYRQETLASIRKVRRLCGELGLLGPWYRRLWQALGLWDLESGSAPRS